MATKAKTSTEVMDPNQLAEWEVLRPKVSMKHKVNKIYACHDKFIGEAVNPKFGKLFSVSHTSIGEEVEHEIVLGKTEMHLIMVRKKVSGNYNKEEGKSDLWAFESNDFETELFNEKDETVFKGNYFELRKKMEKGEIPSIKNVKCEDIAYILIGKFVFRWRLAIGGYLKANELLDVASYKNGLCTFVHSSTEPVVEKGVIKRASFSFEVKGDIEIAKAISHSKVLRKHFKDIAERRNGNQEATAETTSTPIGTTAETTSIPIGTPIGISLGLTSHFHAVEAEPAQAAEQAPLPTTPDESTSNADDVWSEIEQSTK